MCSCTLREASKTACGVFTTVSRSPGPSAEATHGDAPMAGLALLVVCKASQETIAVVKIREALRLSSSIQIFKNKHVSATPPNHAVERRARH